MTVMTAKLFYVEKCYHRPTMAELTEDYYHDRT